MGCGKSTEQVTPAFVTPNTGDKKDAPAAEAPAQHRSSQVHGLVRQKTIQKPLRNSDLVTLYPALNRRAQLRLEYVYGYQSRFATNNLFYLNSSDIIIYPCGSLVVMLSLGSNTQRFLGGGEVHSQHGHFGQVVSLALNKEKDLLASGEVAALPVICVWKMPGSEPFLSLQLGAETHGVNILSFSCDSKLLAAVDMSAEQTIRLFELQTGNQIFAAPSKSGKLHSLSWSPTAPDCFCTAGDANATFWTGSAQAGFAREKAAGGSEAGVSTVKWFANGDCLMGGQDGMVCKWTDRRLVDSRQVLSANVPVYALFINEESILVGSKDWKIHVLDHHFQSIRLIDTPGAPISLDMSSNGIICGTEEGILLEFGEKGRVVLMDVHSGAGQLMSAESSSRLISVCGDNKVKAWDLGLRKCVASGLLEITQAQSQPSALALSPKGQVAVGHKDGHFTIRGNSYQLNNILLAKRENHAEITVMKFAPSGTVLAVGTETGTVLLYNCMARYALLRELKGHKDSILTVDWSESSGVIRVQDNTMALYHWKAETGEGVTDISKEKWASDSVIRSSISGFQPLVSAKARKSSTFAQGTEYGVIELIVPGTDPQPMAFKAHAGPVKGLLWSEEDDALYSVGEEDCCIMQWKFTP